MDNNLNNIRDLQKNRIEIIKVLKGITEEVSRSSDGDIKNYIAILLHQAYMLCLQNAELLNDMLSDIEPIDKSEESELEKQKEFFNSISDNEVKQWIQKRPFEA